MAGAIGNLITRLTAGMRFPTLLTVLIGSIRKRGRTLDPADGAGPPDHP
jgi:hypothetical protein